MWANKELVALICGLRQLQRFGYPYEVDEKLTNEEIDELCENINFETVIPEENVRSSDYFKNIVKRYLLELQDSIKDAKNDSEASFYQGRYAVQLRDFAEALEISEESLTFMVGVRHG